MTTERKDVRSRFTWHSTLAGRLLALIILGALLALPQQAPATPASVSNALKAYVGLFKDNAVAVLDTRTNGVVTTIPVPPGPHGVVVTPDGRKVYVSSDGASTVSIIDTATDRVVKTLEVGPTPHGLALSSDGRWVLASVFGANRAVIIDTARDDIVGEVVVPQPHNSAIDPTGRVAYVGSQQQGATALVIVDLARRTRVGTIPLDHAPRALNFSPDGRRLYFTVAGDDAVQVLDPATNRIVDRVPVGASPHHPLFTPDGRLGLVVSQGPGDLEILDPTGHTMRGTIAVGKLPHWIAVSADSRTAYVTNEGSNTVSVVDLVARRVTATIPVGNGPRKIALQPGSPAAGLDVRTGSAGAPSAPPAPADAPSLTVGHWMFSDHGTAMVIDQPTRALVVDDYYFAPTFLRGRPGQTLHLEIENRSGTLHNVSIPGLRIDQDISPKGKIMVEVTFPPSGALRFFCKFHAALGMNGGLLVGDATPRQISSTFLGTAADVAGACLSGCCRAQAMCNARTTVAADGTW